MFEEVFNNVKHFFESNLETYVNNITAQKPDVTLPTPGRFVVDAFDADKYRDNVVVYIQPQDFEISALSNQTEIVRNRITVLASFRGRDSEQLVTISMRYLEAMRDMVRGNPTLANTVDEARVTDAHIYANVEGANNITAIEMTLLVESEEQ